MRLITLVVLGTLAIPRIAAAQPDELLAKFERRPALVIPDRLVAEQIDQNQGGSRDSILNGMLIGAAIGAATMATISMVICSMLHEPSDPPCWQDAVRVGGLGAVIGAGAGAGIDALRSQSNPAAPPRRLPAVTLAKVRF